MAVSGAILRTLIPLPRHNEGQPPSLKSILKQYPKLENSVPLTCRKTFKRSNGAVAVLETAPATAPATKCLHNDNDDVVVDGVVLGDAVDVDDAEADDIGIGVVAVAGGVAVVADDDEVA